jgi:cytochrome c-type biogenesis protein CcmH/NrfF
MMYGLALWFALAAQTPAVTPAQAADSIRAGGTVQLVAETPIDRQIRELAEQLRCPVCQSQSILESNSALALEMRGLIRERLEAGESPEQIKEYFVGRYGEWILLDPKAEGFNLAVYILPVVAVLIGVVILVFAARRWMRPTGASVMQPDEDPDLAAWEDIRST